MRRFGLLSVLCILCLPALAQQDPQYSMYMFNQLGINPAYAGTRDVLSASMFYRNQWTGFSGAPITEVFNIHAPLRNDKAGVGLQINEDQLGPAKTTSVLATYAYRIKLGKGKLSFGLSGGLMDQVIDYSQIAYKDASDPFATLGAQGKL
ncbi:MAG TPA: PorP/SprF family type IX secretion system membrane protein, partial [Bacteroidia bacterium]|nr:PorP/SprF family type IX secretion system membrane protein [Bacteroidia bacterium]